jgi:hypothetical protein
VRFVAAVATFATFASFAAFALALEGSAAAADTTVAPGQTLTLTADIVLSGTESFVAGMAGGARCTIDGATHSLVAAADWAGRIDISDCDLKNMGTAQVAGVNVMGTADGAIFHVQNTTFGVSGEIDIQSFSEIDFSFRNNTITADSVVLAVMTSLDMSRPSFYFYGPGGSSQKLFQGNRILRSWVKLQDGQNWLVGGSTPVDGNVIVGVRAGFDISGKQMIARGNYVHVTGVIAGWNQVAALYASGADGALLFEHNVVRGGNWLVRSFSGGELRYNLLGDPYAVAHVLVDTGSQARIHHNILIRNNKLMERYILVRGLSVINSSDTPGVQFYNNTLDGSGYCYDVFGRGVEVDSVAFLPSLRSNVFFNIPSDNGSTNTATVGPGNDTNFMAEAKGDPGPVRLGYADYNLFSNPMARQIDNYGVSVAGLTERMSPGFALNDADAMGAKDQQVDPQFTGPLPTVFPFSDDDLIAGNLSVCQILAFYRGIYTPLAGSKVIDKGDPADGAGNDIGAIGAGVEAADDLFGRGCSQADSALPAPPAVETQCTMPIMAGGGSGTGGSGGPTNHGFACVCDAADGAAAAGPSLATLAALALAARLLRPRRRRPHS